MTSGTKGIVSYKGKILLILRDNKPNIPYPNTWEFVGGAQDGDETLEQTGLRELYEELGIKPSNYVFLGTENFSGRLAGRFISILNDNEYRQIHLGSEGQKYAFYTLQESLSLDMPPNLKRFLQNNMQILIGGIEKGMPIDLSKLFLLNERD